MLNHNFSNSSSCSRVTISESGAEEEGEETVMFRERREMRRMERRIRPCSIISGQVVG